MTTAKQMNREYCSGRVSSPDSNGYALWSLHTDAFFSGYLGSIYSEVGTDHNNWSDQD